MELPINEIALAIDGRLVHGKAEGTVRAISTDSRRIRPGELYFALRGARFDGHDFVGSALNTGAGAVVSVPPVAPPSGKWVIIVPDTLKALQALARYVRKKLKVRVVGITGSNGKTTTKEMASAVLGSKMKVHKNAGNLNNQIGLPQSLLKLDEGDGVSVLEMGASKRGDIRELCEIAMPDVGVITNIGQAHLEGFGGIEGVREGKLELLEFADTAVLNSDDKFLMNGVSAYKGRIIRYGTADADVTASDIVLGNNEASFTLNMSGETARIRLGVTGRFNISNALAASAVGLSFGLGAGDVQGALEGFKAIPMRFERREFRGGILLSDVYNANPASMREAVGELVRMRQTRAIAVLGDMLELGPDSARIHAELGAWMARLGTVDCLIAVGPQMAHAAREFETAGGRAIYAINSIEARSALINEMHEGDTVLVKGSRGMAMEGVTSDAL